MSPPDTPRPASWNLSKTPKLARLLRESAALQDRSPSRPSPGQSASKLFALTMTGWTPLISKTYYNDLVMAYNSTPQKHGVPAHSAGSDFVDYTNGLSLTPFLTHTNHSSNMTPLADKSLHLADFFVDSPLPESSCLNDTFLARGTTAITPSRFSLNNPDRVLRVSNSFTSAKPMNGPLDTPMKLPVLSDNIKKEDLLGRNSYPGDEENYPEHNSYSREKENYSQNDSFSSEKENHPPRGGEYSKDSKSPWRSVNRNSGPDGDFQTQSPRKYLNPTTPSRFPRPASCDFKTPLKQQQPASSPLTVLIGSAARSPDYHEPLKTEAAVHLQFGSPSEKQRPPQVQTPFRSPSPSKHAKDRLPRAPVMGLFSEPGHDGHVAVDSTGHTNALQIGSRSCKENIDQSSESVPPPASAPPVQPASAQPDQTFKARMQAGMNKFQIIMSGLSNTDGKKVSKRSQTRQRRNNGRPTLKSAPASRSKSANSHSTLVTFDLPSNTSLAPPMRTHSYSNANTSLAPPIRTHSYSNANTSHSPDYNVTINSSKELSMYSANNSTLQNTSQLNVSSTTDHSSFEMCGVSSTPNGKFFLDKIWEKPSPRNHQFASISHSQPTYSHNDLGSMPPPGKHYQTFSFASQPHRLAPPPQQQQPPPPLQQHQMLNMSTPQRVKDESSQNLFVAHSSLDLDADREHNLFVYHHYTPLEKSLGSTPHHYRENHFPVRSPSRNVSLPLAGSPQDRWSDQ